MKQKIEKISGKVKREKKRIGILYTRSEDSVKKQKTIKMKDIDRLLKWEDK
jgi:hypothetical protein